MSRSDFYFIGVVINAIVYVWGGSSWSLLGLAGFAIAYFINKYEENKGA